MRGHPGLRAAQCISEWLGVFTMIVLIVVFSLAGWMLPPPSMTYPPYPPGYGSADVYAVRPSLLVVFLAAMAIHGILLMMSRMRGMFRYPVEITSSNVEAQYLLGKVMLGFASVATNVGACLTMVLIYQLKIRLNGWGFVYITVGLGVFFVLNWLIYYALARHYA